MKLIFIMSDSFRRDHIGTYGAKWTRTPNLDRLAAMSTVFDRCYVGSFPTLCNRRDIHLGVGYQGKAFNPWTHISNDEIMLAERLREKDVHTMLITDAVNTIFKGANHKGFDFFCINRGQEGDPVWSDNSVPLELSIPSHLIRYPIERWHRVLMNRANRRVEQDWFAPRTFKWACEWLQRNRTRDDFMLWVETFDPHEPWDPPSWYIDYYDEGYEGRVFEAPTYGRCRDMGITDEEAHHIHARYCGECSMVDTAVGQLMTTLEELSLLDQTAIIFTSDHGVYQNLKGDNGLIGKPNRVGSDGMSMAGGAPMTPLLEFLPLRTALMRIPLFIHAPGQKTTRRSDEIVQPWDLTPTIMDMFGIPAPGYY